MPSAFRLPSYVLDAAPSGAKARLLATAYNRRLIASFITLLHNIPSISPLEVDSRISFLSTIDPTRKLHPRLYRLYHLYSDSLRASSATPALNLDDFTSHAYVSDISVEPFFRKGWHLTEIVACFENDRSSSVAVAFNELSATRYNAFATSFAKALAVIHDLAPAQNDEIEVLLSNAYLFDGRTVVGLTSPRFHGAMFLAFPRRQENLIVFCVEHITHEVSHLYLNTLLALDPLVLNSPMEKFDAPIRADKRPMLGVYHATFVLSRIVRILRAYVEYSDLPALREAKDTLLQSEARLLRGLAIIRNHARLSPVGERLIRSINRESGTP